VKRSLIEIYALAVCFVTVTCFAIASGIALYDFVQIAVPEITLHSYIYERHQTNEAFRTAPQGTTESIAGLSEDQLTKRREESYKSALNAERRDGWQSLLRMAIVMLVDLIFFAVHWLLAKRVRESATGI
jgi:hypothetical protein